MLKKYFKKYQKYFINVNVKLISALPTNFSFIIN
jgi:hypothetical protein